MAIWFVDTSAVAKLVRTEPESAAVRRWLRRRHWIGSDLHRTHDPSWAGCPDRQQVARKPPSSGRGTIPAQIGDRSAANAEA